MDISVKYLPVMYVMLMLISNLCMYVNSKVDGLYAIRL